MKASHSPKPRRPAPATPRPRATDALATSANPIVELRRRSREAATLLKALANPDRLLLLCHLVDAEHPVAALGTLTAIAQPTLSQQLRVLRHEGLVATRREGKSIHYRVASPAVLAVLQTLYRLYCAPGAAAIH